MKKYISLLLALILSLSLCVPMMADEPSGVVVDPSAPATVTITSTNNTDATYKAYQLLKLSTSLKCSEALHTHDASCYTDGVLSCGEGHTEHTASCYAYDYTVNTKYVDAILTVLNNGKAEADKIVKTDAQLDKKVYDAISAKKLAADIRDFANAVLAEIEAEELTADTTENIVSGEAATLGQGYWLIVDTSELSDADKAAGVVKSLVMLNTSGQKDINIAAKDSTHTFEKEVDEENSFIGQEKEFTLTYNLPGNLDEYKTYTFQIKDTLPAGLTFITEVGTYSAKVGTGSSAIDVTSSANFEFNGQEMTLDLGAALLAGAKDAQTAASYKGARVTITYKAIVNENAVIDYTGNTNDATLTYTNDPNHNSTGTLESKDTVKTYAIALKKINDKQEPLAGATFKFPFYVKAELDANSEPTGYYLYAGVTAADGLTNEITTDVTGLIVVKGVKADVVYEIEETDAPEGYNKLVEKFSVTATEIGESQSYTSATFKLNEDGDVVDASYTGTMTEYVVSIEDVPATVKVVVNKNGLELPSTGGIGTTIFYAVGGALMAGAVILLITKKKMSNEE